MNAFLPTFYYHRDIRIFSLRMLSGICCDHKSENCVTRQETMKHGLWDVLCQDTLHQPSATTMDNAETCPRSHWAVCFWHF